MGVGLRKCSAERTYDLRTRAQEKRIQTRGTGETKHAILHHWQLAIVAKAAVGTTFFIDVLPGSCDLTRIARNLSIFSKPANPGFLALFAETNVTYLL